jgi:DnaJ-class molecular chaperone
VETARIGPGAVIEIRRSGDVIPTIHSVLTPTVAAMPTGAWEWDATHTHAKTREDSGELRTALMTHFVKTLDGKKVTIKIPHGTTSGKRFRVPGQGIERDARHGRHPERAAVARRGGPVLTPRSGPDA